MTISTILWHIATLLMIIHISYGGWFIMSHYKKPDLFIVSIVAFIGAALINMFFCAGSVNWFWSLIVALLGANLFHFHIRRRIEKVSLQEYVNYKIFIEVYGIFLSLCGIMFFLIFPQFELVLGILNLIFILRLNWLVLSKKRAYWMDYQNPAPLNNPLVSIVIIAFNEEDFIGKTLESIKKQTYRNFEVIVVDDHSVDDTVQIAKHFEQFFPLRVVQKPVRGCSRSRNFGAENSSGEIILFLDADVILPENFLEKGLAEFNSKQLSTAFFNFNPITENSMDHFFTSVYRFWLQATQYHNPHAIGSCIMIRSELHKKILFDETVIMAEDFDYVLRASQHGKFRMINSPCYLLSWRRFAMENRIKLVAKYLFFELHRQLIGEIRKPVLSYTFGQFGKKKS